jgi:hypothetical protein
MIDVSREESMIYTLTGKYIANLSSSTTYLNFLCHQEATPPLETYIFRHFKQPSTIPNVKFSSFH